MRTIPRSIPRTTPLTIPSGFAWLKQLSIQEQANFFSGLLARVRPALKSNDWSSVAEWVEEWKTTANIYADPAVARGVKQGRTDLAQNDAIDWSALRAELGL